MVQSFSKLLRRSFGVLQQDALSKCVTVTGAPMVCGQRYVGTEQAPDFLRDHGLIDKIKECGFNVEDMGNLEFPTRSMLGPRGHYKDVIGVANKHIAEEWCRLAENPSNTTLFLGGDQSIAIGTIAAALKTNEDTVVVWVDAHANLRTPYTSESGSYNEMPLAFSMRLPGTECEHFDWLDDYPILKPENLIYVGLRWLHPSEKAVIQSKKIKTFTMRDIDGLGIGQIMDQMEKLIDGRPIHLTFDVDACDEFYFGEANTNIRGGLTFRESAYICECLSATGNLSSMNVCEVNPLMQIANCTDMECVYFAISMIERCFGKTL